MNTEEKIEKLEQEICAIKSRNVYVEMEKAWETSASGGLRSISRKEIETYE